MAEKIKINPTAVRYIKLGEGGHWEKECSRALSVSALAAQSGSVLNSANPDDGMPSPNLFLAGGRDICGSRRQ
jgi:hypothetical protein